MDEASDDFGYRGEGIDDEQTLMMVASVVGCGQDSQPEVRLILYLKFST